MSLTSITEKIPQYLLNDIPIKTKLSILKEKDQLSTSTQGTIKNIDNIQKVQQIITQVTSKITHLGTSIGNSDKLVRLTNAILKILKSYHLLKNQNKLDKVSYQLSMTRRIFRLNRKWHVLKQLYNFLETKKNTKQNMSVLDTLNIFFKIFILVADLNDMVSYCMQMGLFSKSNYNFLKQNNLDMYFYQSLIWFIIHIFQYLSMRKKGQEQQKTQILLSKIKIKIYLIIKYLCDTIISHNDFRFKIFTLESKIISILGIISSAIGIAMAW